MVIGALYNFMYIKCLYDSGVGVNMVKCAYDQNIHRLVPYLVASFIEFQEVNYYKLSIGGLYVYQCKSLVNKFTSHLLPWIVQGQYCMVPFRTSETLVSNTILVRVLQVKSGMAVYYIENIVISTVFGVSFPVTNEDTTYYE